MTLMPRVNPYAVLSAATINAYADEIESAGRMCRVRRSGSLSVTSAVRTVVPWQIEDVDTNGGGMWNPSAANYITIVTSGTYLILAQVRFDDVGTSPYRAGMRNAYVTVDSTDPSGTACKGAQSQYAANSLNGEGQTLQVHATEALTAGQRVYLIVSQDCGSTIVGCHQNYGGTFLSVTRVAGIA